MSGGLALFWDESLHVEVKEENERFIDVWMGTAPNEPLFHVTFVYGEPRTENKHIMWSKLAALCASSSLPWAFIGDFNEALWSYEQFSARARPEPQMAAFRDGLQICSSKDLGFSGLPLHTITIELVTVMFRYGWIVHQQMTTGEIFTLNHQ
jgi:hypothetical protein